MRPKRASIARCVKHKGRFAVLWWCLSRARAHAHTMTLRREAYSFELALAWLPVCVPLNLPARYHKAIDQEFLQYETRAVS